MNLRIMAGLALLTLAAFFSLPFHEFINYDTPDYIHWNPNVRTGLSLENIQWAFTSVHMSNWHPITWISHMLDVSLFGLDPTGHHVTNLLLHTINVVLLFQILRIMTGALWSAAFVAAVFAIHPAHVESVAWVAERKDLLSTLFLLLTLYGYYRYTKAPSTGRYVLVALLFALGLMSKPMLVTLPFVLLLFDYWPLGRMTDTEELPPGFRRIGVLLYEKLPLLLLSVISAVITFRAQQDSGAMDAGSTLALVERISNAIVAYGYYLKTALIPAELALFYPHPGSWPPLLVWTNLAMLVVISAVSIIWIRRFPWLFVGWAFFLGTLVPVIGLVQVGNQAYADRYTYVPYIGFFIALTFGVREVFIRRAVKQTLLRYGAVSLLVVYSIVSVQYLGHWQNSITIWTHTLLVTDDNYPVLMGLEPGTPDRSIKWLGLVKPYYLLGRALADAGSHAKAVVHFDEALWVKPDMVHAHYHKGNSLLAMGKRDKALAAFRKVKELDPDNPAAPEIIQRIRQEQTP